MNNIFISTSPLVTMASVDLITSKYSGRRYNNYVFIFQKCKEKTNYGKLPDNTSIVTYFTDKLHKMVSSLIIYKYNIEKIINTGESTLFVGNCCHLATNYVALKSGKFKEKCLIIDGIANYYKASSILCGGKLNKYLKYFFGALLGLPYSEYKGHISGSDTGKFTAIYCYNKKQLVSNPGEVKIIDISNKMRYESVENRRIAILVLEQPIERFMFKKGINLARSTLHNYVDKKKKNETNIYMKPHPSFKIREMDFPDDWKIVEKAIPAEMMYKSLGITHIVSYTSSALLTIKDMDKNIQAVSIGVNLIADAESRYTIWNLFFSRGIEIITA